MVIKFRSVSDGNQLRKLMGTASATWRSLWGFSRFFLSKIT